MRYKRFLPVLCFAAAWALPTTALAQPHGPGGPMGPLPMPLMLVLRHADLTTEQQTHVRQIMDANFAQAQPLMKQLDAVHDQIADKLMSTGPVEASDIAPLQQQEAKIHQQLDQQVLSTTLQIRALLTPDQLAKAAELHNKLKSLRAQMEALVGDGGPPPMGPPGF
ncbi:MAG: periplasmic heavy metal sensor [Candidatus Binataceae bacterium]